MGPNETVGWSVGDKVGDKVGFNERVGESVEGDKVGPNVIEGAMVGVKSKHTSISNPEPKSIAGR